MKERGILFSAPMVRALLDGTKTQTRRALKRQPDEHHWQLLPGYELKRSKIVTINERSAVKFSHSIPQNPQWDTALDWLICSYGQPGGQLWVRETFFAWGRWETRFSAKKKRDEWHFIDMTGEDNPYLYAADGYSDTQAFIKRRGGIIPMYWKRPAIFMPRAASRLTLGIADVRVERLQDITEIEAILEGCAYPLGFDGPDSPYRTAYARLWESINGPGSWDANPWVWVVEFKSATPGQAQGGGKE